jgi:hypothetical protein
MIDLTQEEPPLKTDKKYHAPKVVDKLNVDNIESILHPVPVKIASITQPTHPTRFRHSVTFAPIVDSRSPSPAAYNGNHLVFSSPDSAKTTHCEIYPSLCCVVSDKTYTAPVNRTAKSNLWHNERSDPTYYQTSQKKYVQRDGGMQDIVDVRHLS